MADLGEQHHQFADLVSSLAMGRQLVEDIQERAFEELHFKEIEKIKGPFSVLFSNEYYKKSMKQSFFDHDLKKDDGICTEDMIELERPTKETGLKDYLARLQAQKACFEFHPPVIDAHARKRSLPDEY